MKIVVAGASGFVGSQLLKSLEKIPDYEIVALSRSPKTDSTSIKWLQADLFSLRDAELAVQGADVAYYLVHSMLPADRLSQGSFNDYDLIAADNFVKACESQGVRQIIYLSGIVPDDKILSEHLASRYEVEKVLGAYRPALTVIRSGLIIGAQGSTYQIMVKLVERLPLMICPSWTRSKTEVIDVEDVVFLLVFCLDNPDCYSQSFDVGTGEVVSYQELMKVTAEILQRKKLFIPVSVLSRQLSSYWLTLVTGAPLSLTKPIVDSLKHDIVSQNHRLQKIAKLKTTLLRDSIKKSYQEYSQLKKRFVPRAYLKNYKTENKVRSIQRLYLPKGKNAEWVANEYMVFLSKIFIGLIRVEQQENVCKFILAFPQKVLLEISYAPERSQENRQLFYVTGGLLAKSTKRARLEFRVFPSVNVLMAGLHEYEPRLPWWLYLNTQALVHSLVMWTFKKHLYNIDKNL